MASLFLPREIFTPYNETTTKGDSMDKFLNNLKREAEENPILALGVGAALITALSKFVDARGHAKGSQAYARDVERRIQKSK